MEKEKDDAHLKNTCQNFIVECIQKCGMKIKRSEQEMHNKNDCNYT